MTAPAAPPAPFASPRVRAGLVALAVGVVLLGAKFYAWHLTDSNTVLSDAMESIVNVVAAIAALGALYVSSRPRDHSHPYGHGKVEFLTGGFEGGLIAFAAIVIIYESVRALIAGPQPRQLEFGLAIVAGAGVANLLLGIYLVRRGRKLGSMALVADGKHVISDFWTSAGACVGLALVMITGLAWIDPCAAMLVATQLLVTGAKLVREAARGLLDETDPEVVRDIANALEKARVPGVIEVHDLRAINVGGFHHVDLHVVVPEFWNVDRAHSEMDDFERRMKAHRERGGELQFHVDPCERAYCRRCDLAECPVRLHPFEARREFTQQSVSAGPSPAVDRAIHADPNPAPLPG